MGCKEKARLVAEYQSATLKFSEASATLHTRMGTLPKQEYDRLQRATDEARGKSERARIALEKHTATHGC